MQTLLGLHVNVPPARRDVIGWEHVGPDGTVSTARPSGARKMAESVERREVDARKQVSNSGVNPPLSPLVAASYLTRLTPEISPRPLLPQTWKKVRKKHMEGSLGIVFVSDRSVEVIVDKLTQGIKKTYMYKFDSLEYSQSPHHLRSHLIRKI